MTPIDDVIKQTDDAVNRLGQIHGEYVSLSERVRGMEERLEAMYDTGLTPGKLREAARIIDGFWSSLPPEDEDRRRLYQLATQIRRLAEVW